MLNGPGRIWAQRPDMMINKSVQSFRSLFSYAHWRKLNCRLTQVRKLTLLHVRTCLTGMGVIVVEKPLDVTSKQEKRNKREREAFDKGQAYSTIVNSIFSGFQNINWRRLWRMKEIFPSLEFHSHYTNWDPKLQTPAKTTLLTPQTIQILPKKGSNSFFPALQPSLVNHQCFPTPYRARQGMYPESLYPTKTSNPWPSSCKILLNGWGK